MNGFGHWDYADAFTGKEAAHLIAGLDPSLSNSETEYRVRPIVARMKKGYYQAVKTLVSEFNDGAGFFADGEVEHFAQVNPAKKRAPQGGVLWSVEVEDLIANYNHRYVDAGIPDEFEFCDVDRGRLSVEEVARRNKDCLSKERETENARWQGIVNDLHGPLINWAHEYIHEFDEQKFSRPELHRWISESGLPSQYRFETIVPPHLNGTETGDQREISPKSEAAFLHIVGALGELYWAAAHPGQEYSQTALLAALKPYEGFPGMSERNLKDKLTKALRAIRS